MRRQGSVALTLLGIFHYVSSIEVQYFDHVLGHLGLQSLEGQHL